MNSNQLSMSSDPLRTGRQARIFLVLVALCASVFSGCVPATPPTQLQATPGMFVRVDEHSYDAGVFRVAYPAGWRIVKNSIASAPMQVVFVAPEDTMTITVSEIPIVEADTAGMVTRTEEISTANGTIIYLQGHYPTARIAEFEQAWAKIVADLQ